MTRCKVNLDFLMYRFLPSLLHLGIRMIVRYVTDKEDKMAGVTIASETRDVVTDGKRTFCKRLGKACIEDEARPAERKRGKRA